MKLTYENFEELLKTTEKITERLNKDDLIAFLSKLTDKEFKKATKNFRVNFVMFDEVFLDIRDTIFNNVFNKYLNLYIQELTGYNLHNMKNESFHHIVNNKKEFIKSFF